MSIHVKPGVIPRMFLTITAAVFAVSLMIAVPMFAAVDTEAAYTENEIGYTIELTDPTDAQLTATGVSKYHTLTYALLDLTSILNDSTLGQPTTADAGHLYCLKAGGSQVSNELTKDFRVNNVRADDVNIEYTIETGGNLITPFIEYRSESQKAAANAITDYAGSTLAPGDKVSITGRINQETGNDDFCYYKSLDSDKCVLSRESMSYYEVNDTEVTLKITKTDNTSYEIKLLSNIRGMYVEEDTCDYQGDNITVGTEYTYKETKSSSLSGRSYFVVNGQEYTLVTTTADPVTQEDTVDASDIMDQSSITVEPIIAERIAMLPSSSEEGMKIEKTYSAAETAYGNVIMDAVGNDIMKILLIAGAVIVGIVILIAIIIIILVVRKSRRR